MEILQAFQHIFFKKRCIKLLKIVEREILNHHVKLDLADPSKQN